MFKIMFIASLFAFLSCTTVRPYTFDDFAKVTVRVTDISENSGGTGTVIFANAAFSVVLTNAHVCEVLENRGIIHTWKGKFIAQQYKKSLLHDLCLVKVNANLEYKAKISNSPAHSGDPVTVTGYPYLLPQITVYGTVAGTQKVSLVIGVEKCTEEDWNNNPMYCVFLGGIPVLKDFDTQVISALIAPGNSGSAVYNSEGLIVGLVFAGLGRGISYGFIVPHEYVHNFIYREARTLPWQTLSTQRRMEIGTKATKQSRFILPAIYTENTLYLNELLKLLEEGQKRWQDQ